MMKPALNRLLKANIRMETDLPNYHIEKITKSELYTLESLNYTLFREKRIINQTNHDFQIILKACIQDIPIGFKIGYGRKNGEFYSAKGGVLPLYRRLGIARHMLMEMIKLAKEAGFNTFTYDTFPNKNKGMLILGLNENFRVTEAKWNPQYNDFQITLKKGL